MTDSRSRWLYDVLVEAKISMKQDLTVLIHKYPSSDCEIQIRRPVEESLSDRLSVQLILNARDLGHAQEVADYELDRFLRLLMFVTSSPFKIIRKNFLIDWSPGKQMREVIVFQEHRQNPVLNFLGEDVLTTLGMLQAWGVSQVLERAVRWFGAAVRATILEDQFQYFFFAIEILAVNAKKVGPVADRCQQCGSDLYCQTCGGVPTHMPFGSQVIQIALEKIAVPESERKLFLKARNLLMHGSDRSEIEQSIKKVKSSESFGDLVDKIGRVAWIMIFNAFPKPPGKHQPTFLRVNSFVDWSMTFGAVLEVMVGGDPDAPRYEDIRLPTVTLELHDVDDKG